MTQYADKAEMRKALAEWTLARDAADAAGRPHPPVPHIVGAAILAICNRMGSRSNFNGYTYLDEMIGDAILDCTRAVRNYKADHVKQNPFGYFSNIAWRAMLRRIELESNQTKMKRDLFLDENYLGYSIMDGDEAKLDKNELRQNIHQRRMKT